MTVVLNRGHVASSFPLDRTKCSVEALVSELKNQSVEITTNIRDSDGKKDGPKLVCPESFMHESKFYSTTRICN